MCIRDRASALLLGAMISLPAVAAKGGTLVTVNGVAISDNVAGAFLAEQEAQGTPATPELKNAIKEELIRRELLAQEAKKMGLDQQADVAAQADLARQAIFIRAFIQDVYKRQIMPIDVSCAISIGVACATIRRDCWASIGGQSDGATKATRFSWRARRALP